MDILVIPFSASGILLRLSFDIYNGLYYLVSDPFFLCYNPILDYFLPNTYPMTLFMCISGKLWLRHDLFSFSWVNLIKCLILHDTNCLTLRNFWSGTIVGSCCHWCQWFDWLMSNDWLMSKEDQWVVIDTWWIDVVSLVYDALLKKCIDDSLLSYHDW